MTEITNLERIYEIVVKASENKEDIKEMGITTQDIANETDLERDFTSRLLNQLFNEDKLVKIKTKPVIFIAKEVIQKRYGLNVLENTLYKSLEELDELIKSINNHCEDPFDKLVGFDGSLRNQIEQCKAALRYPNNGLPVLITGGSGTGKSFVANIMYEYSKKNNLIESDAPFITFNCAEFANNPELLSANLFGYKKGAFTGADTETKGVIEDADGGILFLDEIHRLPPEGQEKLFLYMDKGTFRRLGETRDLRTSNVRLIFATTEKVEDFLIKTFLRRIPITINIPMLKERPLYEKIKLIYIFFKEESKALKQNLVVTKQALKALLYSNFKGNVGGLRNNIKFACARAYNEHCNKKICNENLEVNMLHLPSNLSENIISKYVNDNIDMMDTISNDMFVDYKSNNIIEALELINQEEVKINRCFYDSLLLRLKESQKKNFSNLENIMMDIDDSFDSLEFGGKLKVLSQSRFNCIHSIVQDTFELLENKYDIVYFDSIGHKISCYIIYSLEHSYFLDVVGYDDKFERYLNIFKDKFKQEYIVTSKISDFLKLNFDIVLNSSQKTVLMLYLKSRNITSDEKKIKAVIIAHGYYTASSIANVANYLLNENIFESFDMPLKVKTSEIVEKLRNYLSKIDISKGLIILVDMGSLEEIYEGLKGIKHGVIGIINNITTQLALDTGNSIMKGLGVEEIVERATESNRSRYKLIKPTEKQKSALITTCITGIGTAVRIRDMLINSLGTYGNKIEILTYDYLKLKGNGKGDNVFTDYNVVAIVGTKNLYIDGIPFFSLEEIISGRREEQFSNVFKGIIPKEGIQQIHESLLKYFSFESILNYITILNPNKIINQIEIAIESLQYALKIRFTNDVKIGLYVHLGCLIERLVTHTQVDKYNDEVINNFKQNNKSFIDIVRRSFSSIEKLYGVNIPLAEIYFIYEILDTKMPNIMLD